ncbi:hypothetical protein [Paucibacter sp. DJ1R-11]|nr:hypothetical protein [Paucibacter sp. DJ1R-11]
MKRGLLSAAVIANQLGGEDGRATVPAMERWLNPRLGKAML